MDPKQREQEELLLRMFNTSMNLGDIPRPSSLPPPRETYFAQPEAHVNLPKPTYASAHYTHTSHIQPTPLRSKSQVTKALLTAGIDPDTLSSVQLSLLSTCPDPEFFQLLHASSSHSIEPASAVPGLEMHDYDCRSTSTADAEAENQVIVPPPRPLSSPGILYVESEPYMLAGYARVAPDMATCSVSRDKGIRLGAIDPVYLGSGNGGFGGNQDQDFQMEM
jgi:hypothetical protein